MADGHLTKHCWRCDADLPLDQFGSNRRKPDGRSIYCKQCTRAQTAERSVAARNPLTELKELARKADLADRKASKVKAARRRAKDEYKAATKVLGPTLAALKAAVAALEALMGPSGGARKKSPQHQAAALAKHARRREAANGSSPPVPLPDGPPSIREIRAIIIEEGVSRSEAKRIQELEIIARAEWRPPITTHRN